MNRFAPLFLLLLLAGSLARAGGPDELFLWDGKSIQGRVTEENDDQYTIRTAKGMYLRIDKSKVSRAEINSRDNRPTVRMAAPKISTAPAAAETTPKVHPSTAPAKSAAPAAAVNTAPVVSTAPVALANPTKGVFVKQRAKGKATFVETIRTETDPITDKNIDDAMSSIYRGKPDPRRLAGRTHQVGPYSWSALWTGDPEVSAGQHRWKSLVVRSTVTLTLPRWSPSPLPVVEERAQWNVWFASFQKHQDEHADIYSAALNSFAEAASILVAGSEDALRTRTEKLFQTMLDEAERRQEGFDRRQKPATPR